MSERAAGILMPISSLPSEYGIGCFSKSAYEFVDWLKKAGQSYWQILPLGPTSYGDSPYQSFSTFAGNPYFISLEALVEEGVLTKAECEAVDWGKAKGSIDYKKIYEGRYPLLRKAYERSKVHENAEYQKFVEENSWWLSDYALFMAVKDRFDGVEWKLWADDIKLRWRHCTRLFRCVFRPASITCLFIIIVSFPETISRTLYIHSILLRKNMYYNWHPIFQKESFIRILRFYRNIQKNFRIVWSIRPHYYSKVKILMKRSNFI